MRSLFFLTLFTILVLPVFAVDSSSVCGDGFVGSGETRSTCCMDVGCGFQMSCEGISNSCIFAEGSDEIQNSPGITGYSSLPIREEFKGIYFMFLGIVILSFVSYYNFFLKK